MTLTGMATRTGRFCVLAIDHRDSLRAFLAPADPSAVAPADLTALKIDLVRELAPFASGVMLEPEYSIPQVLDAGVLPEEVGFSAALESQGYLADPEAAPTTVLDGWSVQAAADCGASAAKLLLPYHPERPLAAAQEQVAREILAECRRVGIPLILEPLFYRLDDPRDRPRVVLDTVARFAAVGPDLLKAPFPVDPATDDDRVAWGRACAEISRRCPMPWALLSGGGSFEVFRDQLVVAIEHGCAGFMVGRALWGEAARAAPRDRTRVSRDLVAHRFRELVTLTEAE